MDSRNIIDPAATVPGVGVRDAQDANMSPLAKSCNDAAKIQHLVSRGHSEHCAQRQVWGDGECECSDVVAGYDPDAWKKATPAPAPLALSRRQRRCIRNSAERFDKLGYAMADELRACFPKAFEQRGKGRM